MAENHPEEPIMFKISDRLFQQLTEFTETLEAEALNPPPNSHSDRTVNPQPDLTPPLPSESPNSPSE
ncbi:hypothetical protein [Arthrospira platensis]|jgi:hypothetical protein|uniref:Uncharacterized protein n=1 Tax=Limnospira platensis NIES-46 TaxID=1236695 RepID=A0A5M3TAY9_LIMPL|nr:hypothetical protein [Arthrospira platensis]AMW31124.1 hypothetical protein AP285_27615 [Arthrospira platensis YZ]MBD2669154.1 hypothetical protein [Arthrospira platensis FACHB-439]MBD2712026.1 hypothetical protein [Arthrospira platensis FACHB-835]MDF2208538.1 hypothetical protein [Arthrospira platensis NCB002]MDT9184618.1 hypothetical protein [Limnospira sp. PMC 289.06]MDT9294619.1 hypothetical protein [Arthrospira platensis PCC 7345]QQW29021.1 hypothetical protein AP9108_30285 [Arthrosp